MGVLVSQGSNSSSYTSPKCIEPVVLYQDGIITMGTGKSLGDSRLEAQARSNLTLCCRRLPVQLCGTMKLATVSYLASQLAGTLKQQLCTGHCDIC